MRRLFLRGLDQDYKAARTHHEEPVDQLSIRGPVRILNDFINYCEDENKSYWEGLEALLKNTK